MKPSTVVRSLCNTNVKMYRLIGGELSPYTAKVRSYLRFKKIPFEPVTANAEIYANFIKPRIGWSVIPVLVTPQNEAIQDSTDIIDYLEQRHPVPSIQPRTPKQKLICSLFELFADEWMVLPIMHYRWSFPENLPFIKEEFGRIGFPEHSTSERSSIAGALYGRFQSMRGVLGINELTAPAIEESWKGLLNELTAHFDEHPYLLGGKPCVADFALGGMMYAHLYRDPVPGMLMKTRAPLVAAWVEHMNGHLPSISRYNVHEVDGEGRVVRKRRPEGSDEYCAWDEIPQTLDPILKRVCGEFGPVLLSTRMRLIQYIKDNPGVTKLPRNIGQHEFQIGGITSERGIFPFNIWMWQRVTDIYRDMNDRDKRESSTMMSQYPHGVDIIEANLDSCRVGRKANFLHAVLHKSKI
ncbi:uncharacterized protein LOC100180334 [Ciona intestinalis]